MLILPREAEGLFCIEERFRERDSRGSPSLDIQQVISEGFVVLMAGHTGLGVRGAPREQVHEDINMGTCIWNHRKPRLRIGLY